MDELSEGHGALTASEQLGFLAFMILALIYGLVFVYFGAFIPALLLIYGYFQMRSNKDFDHVRVTTKFAKLYLRLLILFAILTTAFFAVLPFIRETDVYPLLGVETIYRGIYGYEFRWDLLIAPLVLALLLWGYIRAIRTLFFAPLERRQEWVKQNGVFSSKPKRAKVEAKTASDLDIIQSEKLKQFSVADELSKWAKLRDDGIVSEAEFEEARAKLLNKDPNTGGAA